MVRRSKRFGEGAAVEDKTSLERIGIRFAGGVVLLNLLSVGAASCPLGLGGLRHLVQLARLHIVGVASNHSARLDEALGSKQRHVILDALVHIREGEELLVADVHTQVRLDHARQDRVREGEHPAVGVVDDHDLGGGQQLLGDAQASDSLGGATACVADNVRVAGNTGKNGTELAGVETDGVAAAPQSRIARQRALGNPLGSDQLAVGGQAEPFAPTHPSFRPRTAAGIIRASMQTWT